MSILGSVDDMEGNQKVRTKNTLGQRPTEAEFARMPRYASAYIERLERERDALRARLAELRPAAQASEAS